MKQREFLPENHISVGAGSEEEILADWIKSNPPEYKKGDIVKVEFHHGSDHWGHAVESEPEGVFEVVGHLKLRCNSDGLRKEEDRQGYFWKYILKDKDGNYEVSEASRTYIEEGWTHTDSRRDLYKVKFGNTYKKYCLCCLMDFSSQKVQNRVTFTLIKP